MPSQTSDRVSSIAARYRRITESDLRAALVTDAGASRVVRELRAMSASLHRQDEHKGLRGLVRKMFGK